MSITQLCKILVASNFPSWELGTSNMLKSGGRSSDVVTFADSGSKALEIARADPPDMIIYYLWTFDLDGFDFCRTLQAVTPSGRPPTLLQAAIAPQLIYPKAQSVGAAGYLYQPIAADALVAARDALLMGESFFPTQPSRRMPFDAATPTKGCRVLTCGYDPDLADLIQIVLGRGRNDELRYVPDAPHLLIAAEQSPPDLILLPVMMPIMDGWEACRRLRMIPRLQRVPVLFCATAMGPGLYQHVQQVGGQGYLKMPFEAQELFAARDALLRGETYFPASKV